MVDFPDRCCESVVVFGGLGFVWGPGDFWVSHKLVDRLFPKVPKWDVIVNSLASGQLIILFLILLLLTFLRASHGAKHYLGRPFARGFELRRNVALTGSRRFSAVF